MAQDDIRVKFTPDGAESIIGALKDIRAQAGLAVAAVAAISIGIVAKTMEAIDSQAKLARQLRATAQGLETLKRAASLAGIEQEKMDKATRNLDVRLGEALQGEKAASEAFKRLGLNVAEFSKLDADERINAINRALLANVPAAERAAVAGEMFGKKLGMAIASISEEDLAAAREEVQALGLAVSEVDSQTIERANDAFSVIGETARGAANRVTVALAPALEAIAQKIRTIVIENEGFKEGIEAALDAGVFVAGHLADALHGLHLIYKSLVVAGQEWLATTAEIGAKVNTVFEQVVDMAIENINTLIRSLNQIPGVDIAEIVFTGHKKIPAIMREIADSTRKTANESRAELEALAAQPLPSEGLVHSLREIKDAADEVSRAAINARNAMSGGGESSQRDPEAEKRLEKLRDALRTQFETEQHNHSERLKELEEFRRKGLLKEQEYNELLAKENTRHLDAVKAMQDKLQSGLLSAADAERAVHMKKLKELQDARGEGLLVDRKYNELEAQEKARHDAAMQTEQGTNQKKLAALADERAQGLLTQKEYDNQLEQEKARHDAAMQTEQATTSSNVGNLEKNKREEESRKASLITQKEYNELEALEQARHDAVLRDMKAKQDQEWMRVQEQRVVNLENLRVSLLDEEDAELEHYQRKLEQLVAAAEEELITDERYKQMREELEKQHQEKIKKIREGYAGDWTKWNKMTMAQQTQTVLGELVNMTAGIAQHSRKAFEINKAAGIANAVVNAYVGISKTLSSYPYPWNIALAAAHGVAAFAQINAIRSQSFQGGGAGAAPALAGSTAAPAVSPVDTGAGGASGGSGGNSIQRIFNIHVSGSSRAVFEEFAQQMNSLAQDGFVFKLQN